MAKVDTDSATATMEANLKEKSGRTVEEWVKMLAGSKGKKHSEIVGLLKSDHGMTHGYANLVAHRLRESSADHSDGDDLVAAQYAGKKEALRPVYDSLVRQIEGFGDDVELAPKKAYVSVRRKKQFALLQPSTATRLDVGIKLKGETPTKRLEASGSFNSMVSHRVRVESESDIDAELTGWLRKAYDEAG